MTVETTAAVLRAQDGPYQLEKIDLPPVGPDQLLVRIVSAGVCHTDSLLRLMPGAPLPMIAGHEGAGVVEQVGSSVIGVEAGDHVVLSYDSCGRCRNCRSAHTSYCDEFMARNLLGLALDGSPPAVDAHGDTVGSRWFGQSSFATYAIANVRNAVVVDRSLDLELLGPLGCGVQTGAGSVLNALRVPPGATLAVFGVGAVGLAAVMAAVIAGASMIVAVDRHQHRLDLALSLGATHVIDAAATPELAAAVQSLTCGGADFALDTTGVPSVIGAAVAGLRMTGVCGLVGAGIEPFSLPTGAVMGRTILGIFEGNAVPQVFIPRLIDFWCAGRFPFHRLVDRYSLAEVNEAERASLAGDVVKPVLLPAS